LQAFQIAGLLPIAQKFNAIIAETQAWRDVPISPESSARSGLFCLSYFGFHETQINLSLIDEAQSDRPSALLGSIDWGEAQEI
jgi:hypothetical protein